MPIWFHSKNPETAWLSNLSPHGFTLDGVKWRSVEHFYQAEKYADAGTRELIRKAATADGARKAGRNRALVARPDWEDVKVEVMRVALAAKFGQNRRLREMLLATGEEELVHESSKDHFWGRGKDGEGLNALGGLLMELRGEL